MLLAKLISPGISLQRIQLLSIGVTNIRSLKFDAKDEFHNILLTKMKEGEQFLILAADLMSENQTKLTITIKYFIRGQKQYFSPKNNASIKTDEKNIKLSKENIIEYLQLINQESSYFTNNEIAKLNGTKLPIPNQLIFGIILDDFVENTNNADHKNSFTVYFSKQIYQGEDSKFYKTSNEEYTI